jgi:plastocyanin
VAGATVAYPLAVHRLRGPWPAIPGALAILWLLVMAGGIARGASQSVAASNFVFTRDVVTIAPGDTVTWTFAGEPHTVTSGTVTAGIPHPDGRFDSGIRGPGDTFALGPGGAANPFTTPGTYAYYCAVHAEQMTGTIVVVAAATPLGTPPTVTVPPTPAPSTSPRSSAPATVASPGTPRPTGASPSPSPAPPGPSASISGPLIAGLVALGAVAVAIGLLVRQRRPRR